MVFFKGILTGILSVALEISERKLDLFISKRPSQA